MSNIYKTKSDLFNTENLGFSPKRQRMLANQTYLDTPAGLGRLSQQSVKQHFLEQGVHPKVIERLQGAGFFGSLINGIGKTAKFIINNKDNIEKAVKTGIDVYKSGKSVYDMLKGGMMTNGGAGLKGNVHSAGKLSAGKLNPKMRHRIDFMGALMKQGKTMKQASDEYKKLYPASKSAKLTRKIQL